MNTNLNELLAVMARLRDKENGCPWDLKQDFKSIAPHAIEEAYEVADAIDRDDMNDLKDELGDLLLQVVFQAQMASEENYFTFDDIVVHLKDKLLRRHPHIFGDKTAETADDVTVVWDNVKKQEKAANKAGQAPSSDEIPSALDGIIPNLPIMTQAYKTARKAIKAGFDWPCVQDICRHVNSEVQELIDEIDKEHPDDELIKGELGDVMFTTLTVCAKLGINPEEPLRQSLTKIQKRFRHMENTMHADGHTMDTSDYDTREEYWKLAKKAVG